MTPEWQVRTGGAADLGLVRPLWVAVHHQHAQTMPQLAPMSATMRRGGCRGCYTRSCSPRPTPLLLLAFVGDAAVGYGLAHVLPVDETWIPDTWKTSSRIGEIESLSVLPEYRGSGLGSELLNRLEQHLHAL